MAGRVAHALAWVTALTVLVPGAAAEYAFTLGTPTVSGLPVVPDVGTAQIQVSWLLTCTPPEMGGLVSSTAPLLWDPPMATDQNFLIRGELQEEIPVPDCVQQTETGGTSTFTVQATSDAEGEVLHPVVLRARAGNGGPTGFGPLEAEATTHLMAQFHGLIFVFMEETVQDARSGGTSTYAMRISNFGNAPADIHFDVVEQSGKAQLVLPAPLRLPRHDGNGTQGMDLDIQVHHPAGVGARESTFVLQFTPVSTRNPENVGQPVQLNVLARTSGLGGQDAPPLPVVGVALAGLAAAWTRRR